MGSYNNNLENNAMSIIRYTSYFLFSLMFTGCGTTSSVNFTQATNNQNSSFLMLDERPVNSKQSHDENVAEGHKYYYGDNNLNPAGPELLKAFLQNRLGAELSGKTVSCDAV